MERNTLWRGSKLTGRITLSKAAELTYYKHVANTPTLPSPRRGRELTDEQVVEIRRLKHFEKLSIKQIVTRMNLTSSVSTVTQAVSRKTYKDVVAPFEKIVKVNCRWRVVVDMDYYETS